MIWKRITTGAGVAACALAVLALAACGGSSSSSSGGGASGEMTNVTVQFTWKVKGEYAGLYMADEQGYYADEGLNVKFEEGQGSQTTLSSVANSGGNNVFVVAPMNQAASAIAQGLPFVSVATYQGKVPSVLVAKPDVKLDSPKDLEGLNVGITNDSNASLIFDEFLSKNGVDKSKVHLTMLDQAAIHPAFLSGNLDVIDAFTTADVPLLQQEVEGNLHVLYFADWGFPALGSGIVVTKQFADGNADVITRFLRATSKGMQAMKDDPETAAQVMKDRYPTGLPDMEATLGQVQATADSTEKDGDHEYGWVSAEAWQAMLDNLQETGVIEDAGTADQYFTNDFLE